MNSALIRYNVREFFNSIKASCYWHLLTQDMGSSARICDLSRMNDRYNVSILLYVHYFFLSHFTERNNGILKVHCNIILLSVNRSPTLSHPSGFWTRFLNLFSLLCVTCRASVSVFTIVLVLLSLQARMFS